MFCLREHIKRFNRFDTKIIVFPVIARARRIFDQHAVLFNKRSRQNSEIPRQSSGIATDHHESFDFRFQNRIQYAPRHACPRRIENQHGFFAVFFRHDPRQFRRGVAADVRHIRKIVFFLQRFRARRSLGVEFDAVRPFCAPRRHRRHQSAARIGVDHHFRAARKACFHRPFV